MYPQAASERLTITSDSVLEELSDDPKELSFSEQQGEVSRSSKRLLPDRTHAAHNRANEKLVHFIVKQRMVERRLLVCLNDTCVTVVILGLYVISPMLSQYSVHTPVGHAFTFAYHSVLSVNIYF